MTFKVGDVVYKGYSPATVGIVIKIEVREWDFEHAGKRHVPVITVRKANGRIWESPQGYASNYRTLIEDHRRKLETHEAALTKLLNAVDPK